MPTASLIVLIAAVGLQEGPAARWKLDGDAGGGKITGRAQFVDSPIGSAGQMLALNGIDAFAQVDPPGTLGAGAGDLTVAFWICPLEMRDAVLLSRGDAARGWAFLLGKDGSLRFQASSGDSVQSEAKKVVLNRWFHVAAARRSGGTVALSVNAEAVASAEARPGDLDPAKAPLRFGRGAEEGRLFCGLLDDVRLYPRALDGTALARLADEGLPWVRPRARAPFAGKFALESDDVVGFVGGENVLAAQEAGHLEAVLSLQARGKRVLFRTLAWEGDTVFEQPRLFNFGSWRDQLARAGATVLFAHFGQMEALEGKAGLERFTSAYDRLLAEFEETTRRIVVVSPFPYEKAASRDLSERNGDLRLYGEAMRGIAARRGLLFVDLLGARFDGPLTRDGLHLTAEGQAAVARETARQLGGAIGEDPGPLRRAIAKKNALWMEYWRPSNWAFLNGDRIEQPSSRDHLDRRVRWFPVEVQQRLALLRREEAALATLLGAPR